MRARKITKNPKTGLYEYVFELAPTYTPEGKKVRNRKVIKRKNKKELSEAVDKLERELNERGTLTTGGLNVEQWFTRWLEEAAKEVRPNTIAGYRGMVRNHIVPGLGPRTKLEKVTGEHLRVIYRAMADKGLSSTYMLQAHRVMSSSFTDAVREGLLMRNPAKLIKAPRKSAFEPDVLTEREAGDLLLHLVNTVDESGDNEELRWATAIITGMRRGEVIGLERSRVFVNSHRVEADVSWQLQRIAHEHGCGGTCNRKRGGDCPDKRLVLPADYLCRHVTGGLYLTQPKTNTGTRIVPLPEPLGSRVIAALRQGENEWGLLFLHNGKPRDPDQDTAAWREMKNRLYPGRKVRLHDLRHTAVDLMYGAGVPEDIIQELVGHSTRAMSRAYKSKGNHERLHGSMAKITDLVTPQAVESAGMREIGA